MHKPDFTPNTVLIIQTAFIGDVILATALIEKIRSAFPHAKVDFMVRKGNERLLAGNPLLNEVLIWDKKKRWSSAFRLFRQIRRKRYDLVVNAQRFATTGFLTAFSGARKTVGFDKNPFSFLFSVSVKHVFGKEHEVDRNQKLIAGFTDTISAKPRLYPQQEHIDRAAPYIKEKFLTISPGSVWFTKQYPVDRWIEFLNRVDPAYTVYILGGKDDWENGETIRTRTTHQGVVNFSGKLGLLESAWLMKHAFMNFTNDSSPLHLASAMNAPVAAVFCSTIPNFGFTPLSDRSFVIEIPDKLPCRPCGFHGHKQCPQGHFKCAWDIRVEDLLASLD